MRSHEGGASGSYACYLGNASPNNSDDHSLPEFYERFPRAVTIAELAI